MTDVLISDLHLSPQSVELTDEFLRILKIYAKPNNRLFILGDFFDVYLGPDINTDFQTRLAEACQQATTQGLLIYFMVGNRDFLINKNFLNKANLIYLPDPSILEIEGHRVLLKHGDDLCSQDKRHQIFRKISRQPWVTNTFLSLPKFIRQTIANFIKKLSRGHQPQYNAITDANLKTIEATLTHHQTTILIHGHTHRPGIHQWHHNHQQLTRYVLPDWQKTAKGLLCTPNQPWQLIDL